MTVVVSVAQADDVVADMPTEPLWEWFLAGFVRYGAAYPGSSESQVNALPLPFPRYRGKFLRLGEDTENPVRGRLFRRDQVKLDLDLDINFGADSEDIDVRRGMPDLDFLLEAGPELELRFIDHPSDWAAYLNLQLRGAFSWDGLNPSYRGLVFSPELEWRKQLSTGLRDGISVRIKPSIATRDYMRYYYGVDTSFATPSRPAFDARAGYLGTEISLRARKQIGSAYEVVAGVKLGLLQGATNEDSPLLDDTVNSEVFVAFLWKFWESKRRVPVEE